MVYYRKYRPQKVSELDLEDVRGKIESILRAKEIPHAFLFSGPKGLGKTSAARILAKAINCEQKQLTTNKGQLTKKSQLSVVSSQLSDIEPCNVCDNCVSITNGSNIDVLEVDAASNRGIDEIRDLRGKIKYAPAALRKKVYIIDEVHMLTTDAFNALLKTLEEPPSHAVFILCTTEVEKVPGTIASRTFHVQFKKPTKDEIFHSLLRIVKGEKLDVDKQVLDEIFKLSEGSFRDAAKTLEELVIARKGKITVEVLETTFKTAGMEHEIDKLLEAVAQKNLKEALKIIDELSQKGTDFKILTERIAQSLHEMLLSGSSEFQPHELRELLNLANNSYRDIKFSVLPQIPLELVVVEWCLTPTGEIKNEKLKIKNEITEISSQIENKSEQQIANSETGMFSANAKSDNFIQALIVAVKQDNHSIAGILRGCRLIEISEGKVQFETKYKFHKDKLSEAKVNLVLDTRASEILREKVHVVVNLTEK
ncbi:MAG: DNA polymerase III subunit gamma/tau [Candidatus Levybacteria bacterium]|nr:DNA polymerase III subunit gamma/tau [Candidatus Levybacteria bacterium]